MAKKKTSVIQVMITGDAKDLQRATGAAGNSLALLGTLAVQAASSIITTMAAGVIAATKFESAFAGVTKTVDGTAAELQELSDGIREMSRRLPATSTEIAAVAEAAGQLGIETGSILEFSEVMINLGETTNLSATEAATQLARLANITQMPQEEFDRLGSVIVDLGNNFETTEAEIVQMGLGLAGAGSIVGMTEPQILAFAAALSSIGIESEAGASAVSRVMLDMQQSVLAGGTELVKLAKIAGSSADDFKRAFEKDAAGAFATFISGLQRIQGEGGNVVGALNELGFSEVRVRKALLGMVQSGDLLTETLSTASKAWGENTALSEEAQKRYDTFAAQLEIVRNNLTDLGIELGLVFLPYLKDLAAWLIENRDRIREFFEGGIEKVRELTALAVEKGAEFKKTFDEDYSGSVDSFREAMLTAWETAFPALEDIANVARTFVEELTKAINEEDPRKIGEAVGNLLSSAMRESVDIIALIAEVLSEEVEKRGGWYEIGKSFSKIALQFILGVFSGALSAENWTTMIETIVQNFGDILVLALSFGALPARLTSAIAGVLRRIPIAGPLVAGMTEGLASVGRQLWRPITSLTSGLVAGFKTGFARLGPVVADDIGRVGQSAATAVDNATPVIKSAWGRWFAGIGEEIGVRFGLLRATLALQKDEAIGFLGRFVDDFLKVGKDWIQGMINGASSMRASLEAAAKRLAKQALDAMKKELGIKSPSVEMMLIGMDMMRGMAIGLEKGSGLVLEVLDDFAGQSLNAAMTVPELPAGVGARGNVYNTVNVTGAIDPEGTARTILRVLQDAERRTGARL